MILSKIDLFSWSKTWIRLVPLLWRSCVCVFFIIKIAPFCPCQTLVRNLFEFWFDFFFAIPFIRNLTVVYRYRIWFYDFYLRFSENWKNTTANSSKIISCKQNFYLTNLDFKMVAYVIRLQNMNNGVFLKNLNFN